MAAKEYLLTIPPYAERTMFVVFPCHVGFDPNGEPIAIDTLNPDHFGRSYLQGGKVALTWNAVCECDSLDEVTEVHGFHGGAIVSPRVRDIIEAEQVPNVEFIPLVVRRRSDEAVLANWWFVNVFNWRQAFDFARSDVTYVDFIEPLSGTAAMSRRFSDKLALEWNELRVNPDQIRDGLFLTEAPNENIWMKLFISERLASRINEGLPEEKRLSFSKFFLDRGPGPKWKLSEYRYAG